MAVADVIMGKAGPNMLFEAITLGKPFIATSYIPGQEEANLEFIRRHKLGWVAIKAEQQEVLLKKLLVGPSELETIVANVVAYRQWNAEGINRIVPIIEGLLH
jgi:processive 1,2-diacylglycerol beta-glucosyltransferase